VRAELADIDRRLPVNWRRLVVIPGNPDQLDICGACRKFTYNFERGNAGSAGHSMPALLQRHSHSHDVNLAATACPQHACQVAQRSRRSRTAAGSLLSTGTRA
jgi:hypothetical protein